PTSATSTSSFFATSGDPRDLPSFPTRRSSDLDVSGDVTHRHRVARVERACAVDVDGLRGDVGAPLGLEGLAVLLGGLLGHWGSLDRKSTRLNSSHSQISYAVFCLKKKKKK